MATVAHRHPLPDGRRFEHAHEVAADQGRAAAPGSQHELMPLGQAHPELAGVEQAPAPGSPADYRLEAIRLRQQAEWHRGQAIELNRRATELELRANRDELAPPDAGEQLRRLLD